MQFPYLNPFVESISPTVFTKCFVPDEQFTELREPTNRQVLDPNIKHTRSYELNVRIAYKLQSFVSDAMSGGTLDMVYGLVSEWALGESGVGDLWEGGQVLWNGEVAVSWDVRLWCSGILFVSLSRGQILL